MELDSESPNKNSTNPLVEWIVKEGGPLLLVGRQAYQFWSGVEKPKSSKEKTSDYQRACRLKKKVDVISVESSQGLVLSESSTSVGYLPIFPMGAIIALDFESEPLDDQFLLELISQIPEKKWKDTNIRWSNSEIESLLLSATESGEPFYFGALSVYLDLGEYKIEKASLGKDSSPQLYRLTPLKLLSNNAYEKKKADEIFKREQQKKKKEEAIKALQKEDTSWIQKHFFSLNSQGLIEIFEEALEFLRKSSHLHALSLVLTKYDHLEINQNQRQALVPAQLKVFQMGLDSPPPQTFTDFEELFCWLLNSGKLDNVEMDSLLRVSDQIKLSLKAMERLFTDEKNDFSANYPLRFLRKQILNWQEPQDIQFFYQLVLAPRFKVFSPQVLLAFYDVALEIERNEKFPALSFSSTSLKMIAASPREALQKILDYFNNPEGSKITDAMTWEARFLQRRDESFFRSLSKEEKAIIQKLQQTLKKRLESGPVNTELRQAISVFAKEMPDSV